MKLTIPAVIIPTVSLCAVALPIALNAQSLVSGSPASCYSALLSGSPPTLSASIQSINSNGTVVVDGVDTAQPTTSFQWAWGDGSKTSGFFPQQHVYANTNQNYVVTITATENNGTTQQFSFPVYFVPPSITPQALAGVSFQIPSQAVTLLAHWPTPPPTNVEPFPDSSFLTYSRSDLAYVLAAIASIDYNFANENSFLLNGVFSIDMLELTNFGGGESFWYTTPMSVGYGPNVVAPPPQSYIFAPSPQWYILFNEIGKNTTLNSPQSLTFGGNTDGNASEIYSETMGDIFSYASGCQLISNASAYGIGADVKQDIQNSLLIGAEGLQAAFNAYVAAGAPFSSWNPYNGGTDPTLGTFSTLAWKFIQHAELQGLGYATPTTRLMKLLQMFNASMLANYAPQENTEAAATFRSTLMVAALSYAFSADLRSEFEALNFPIDDSIFEGLYQMASGEGTPAITNLIPAQATAGSGMFTLVVTGSGFVSGSTVQWNGAPLSTTFISDTQVTASVAASLVLNPGNTSVTVMNPGGVISNAATFTISSSGTGKTQDLPDIGVYRGSSGLGEFFLNLDETTYNYRAANTITGFYGLAGDQPVAGDWTGSGVVRIGVFRNGAWYLDLNNDGVFESNEGPFFFGQPGDIAVVGDWNHTGVSKFGVFRCPASGGCQWYLSTAVTAANSSATLVPNNVIYTPATTIVDSYGSPGDKPVVNNWSSAVPGDQIGVFRCPAMAACTWIVNSSGTGSYSASDAQYAYGSTGDLPVVGDWNGTGIRRIGVFRNGTWILNTTGTGAYSASADQQASFGQAGDVPMVGKWTLP